MSDFKNINTAQSKPVSRCGGSASLITHLVVMLCLVCLAGHSMAQSAVGAIRGQVVDAATGRSLEGAVVTLSGTTIRRVTDASGRYVLNDVPVGAYTVEVRYVGLSAVKNTVNVDADEATEFNVNLPGLSEIETVHVVGSETGRTRAINQQKTAAGIVNFIPEELFGEMIDGNIGQAMQRLPGISVDEDQDGSPSSINIRGVSGQFNSVQIDGMRIPSSGGTNAFDARSLAADGVTTIEVIKAPTPDRDGDAIGGIVNLVSRSAFERTGREGSIELDGTYNDESSNWGNAVKAQFSDLFSVGSGENNLGVSFSLSHYDTDRFSINADQDWVQVDPETNPELDLDQYNEPVWFMESTHFEHDTRETKTSTLSGSIDYRASDSLELYVRPLISYYERGGNKYETDIDIDTAFGNDADGDKTYAALTPTYGRGTEDSEASRGWIGTLEDIENELYSISFGGTHELESSTLTFDVSYSSNERTIHNDTELNMLMEPEDPWFIFEYNVIDPDGMVEVNVVNGVDSTDLSQMTEGELEVVSGTKSEQAFSAKVDWERYFSGDYGAFTLKTGAKYRQSTPEQDYHVDLYEMDDAFPYADVLESTDEILLLKPKYFNVQTQAGLDLLNSNPELFEYVDDDSLEGSNVEDYEAEERIGAAYVMGTYETGIHTLIAGVRLEQYEWENTNKIVSYLNDEPQVTPIENGERYTFWLPGVHLRHALSENLILRESYNMSYARPPLEELSRGRWVDDEGNIEDGNPFLEPATSDNFDIQLEYYTDHGDLYSIGYFYKKISDFTYTLTYDFNDLDENGIPIEDDEGDLEYERPVNGTDATNQGIELIARQGMHFLPGMWSGFGVAVSATFSDSDADYPNRTDRDDLSLEGFSEEIYTAMLEYNWGGFNARIDYRYRDDYIEGLGSDIESDEFYAAEERWDAELHYRFTEHLVLSATGVNLTDSPQISYQGYPQFVEDASYSGRKYSIGLRYDF